MFKKLEKFEREMREREEAAAKARTEKDERKRLKAVVRDVLPADLKNLRRKRPPGRAAIGGLSKREVAELKARAARFLKGGGGLAELEAEVQHTAIVILLIDGLLGTEPWRAAGSGPHAGIIPANARMRYLENANRLLQDLRAARGNEDATQELLPPLLEGVIDAEPADEPPPSEPEPPEDES